MRRAAVIDIGSNSVRLAVYGIRGASLISLFDEKAMCGLGRCLTQTGRLHPEGRRQALIELRRFARVAADEEPEALFPFATAAVRDATDGEDFIAEVARETGLQIQVISGLEEAGLAAKGVTGAIPGATGLVGDLGGGSLELVRVENGELREQVSLPIGPLRRKGGAVDKETLDWIDAALAEVDWLGQCAGQPFFPVGGAWRAFARVHMQQQQYPLPVIHHYTMTSASVQGLAEVLAIMSRRSADLMGSVPKKRRAVIPYASLVISRVIAKARPSQVIASAHGLREGLLHDRLSFREGDPLLDYCRFTGATMARIAPAGQDICDWLMPLFRDDPAISPRIVEAACWMADVAGREHPDRRAYTGYTRALHLPAVAFDHHERGCLATAIRCRYSGNLKGDALSTARHLTPQETIDSAIRLGFVLRMGQAISPTGRSLDATSLSLSDDHLTLTGPAALLGGETIERRLAAAAGAFGRQPQLLTSS